jgi:transposase InsO family protein
MREDGLPGRAPRRRRVGTTNSNHAYSIAPNLLNRQFAVNGVALNRVWVSDITFVPTQEGWVYLVAVLDLASRRCVGWAMRDTLESADGSRQRRRRPPGIGSALGPRAGD